MKVEVKFTIDLPDISHTQEDLEHYLKYITGAINAPQKENPFIKQQFEINKQKVNYEYEVIS